MNFKNNLYTRYFIVILFSMIITVVRGQTYKIVDTGQNKYYDNFNVISVPSANSIFYAQDAQYKNNPHSYTDNNDGTITDNITGLMWLRSPDLNGDGDIDAADKLSYEEAVSGAELFNLADYADWRLPTIKELYSLIMFSGEDPSGYDGSTTEGLVPFINTDYFDFGYGDTGSGERIIDAQFATSTVYTGTTMMGAQTMFGVNFADGRIKGYPTGPMPGQTDDKRFYILYVRGNSEYGKNNFTENGDGTITDKATGLMWLQGDNGEGLQWQDALNWIKTINEENYLGYNDWRLPNAKELQSIVDYTRSPSISNSASINPLFTCTSITDEGGKTNYPFYWSSTTHANMNNGGNAVYLCFGEGLGWMRDPFGNYQLMDVHGAGAQRSDPKEGNPENYPYGKGPQGDVIRIYNYIRPVRDVVTTDMKEGQSEVIEILNDFELYQNYPNPFNPTTTIKYDIPNVFDKGTAHELSLRVYDILGNEITTLVNGNQSPGTYEIIFDAGDLASGVYLYKLEFGNFRQVKRMVLLR